MSKESHSSTCGTVVEDASCSSEFRLSKEDSKRIELLNNIHSQQSEKQFELSDGDLSVVSSFDEQSRVIINVSQDKYEIKIYDSNSDPYQRDYISSVFLNGTPFELRDSGLELFNVTVFIYKTQTNEYIASLWTEN